MVRANREGVVVARVARAAVVFVAALVAVLAVASCGDPPVSDTGYAGTWTRGNDRVTAVVSIHPGGDGYLYRVSLDTDDDHWRLRCDWDGRCVEYRDDEEIAEYAFRTWIDPDTTHLMVEYDRDATDPEVADETVREEVVLADDGLSLSIYTLRRGEETFEGGARPRRRYTKVADTVADPPR